MPHTAHKHKSASLSVLQHDPTRTLTLRNAFASQMARRFRELRGVIWQAIVVEDVFGLVTAEPLFIRLVASQNLTTPGPNAFNFTRSADKVDAFMIWLQEQEQKGVLQTFQVQQIGVGVETPWTNTFIQSSYQSGIQQARGNLRKAGFDIPSLEETGGIEVAFNNPFHADRAGLAFTRTFNELRGVTASMDQQISRVLAQGLSQGQGPRVIARRINQTIAGPTLELTDTLGRFIPAERRAKILARTETIRAHAEATLQEFENWGVVGVTATAELRTAGDDRVCFSKYIQVVTEHGNIPIHKIKVGDKVLTRTGYKPVTHTGKKRTSEKIVRVYVEGSHVTCTADHLIWTESRHFVRADSLFLGDLVQLSSNKLVNVLRVVDLGFGNANNRKSFGVKKLVASLISFFGFFMPIIPVNFKGDVTDGEVNIKLTNFKFLDKFNVLSLQRFSNGFFNPRLASGFHVTTSGTMNSVVPAFFIRSTIKKLFSTLSAFFISPAIRLYSTLNRTIIIPMANTFFYCKGFITTFAYYINCIVPVSIIARARTKAHIFSSGIKRLPAIFANTLRDINFGNRITRMRTISPVRATLFLDRFIMTLKHFTAMATCKFKRHYYNLLNSVSLLYHQLSAIQPFVYDLTIKDQPEFYANGILVHNCVLCQDLEGQIFTIAEARGIIPVHPACRCIWLPNRGTRPLPRQFTRDRELISPEAR